METITIKLHETDDEYGRTFYQAEYEPEIVKPLCLALIADAVLQDTVKYALAYTLSKEEDPDKILLSIRQVAKEISDSREQGKP